jgi:hypothetical protein
VKASRADELDVKGAAQVAGRTAETIRRWVWSGRLAARKRGNRLMVARGDVEALAGAGGGPALSLSEWAKLAEAALRGRHGPYESATDLVIEERQRRLEGVGSRSRR